MLLKQKFDIGVGGKVWDCPTDWCLEVCVVLLVYSYLRVRITPFQIIFIYHRYLRAYLLF